MTDRYAVVGNPIAQSKSPIIHSLFAQATVQDLIYDRVEAPLDGFAKTLDYLRVEGFRGINITAPFKLEAFAYATARSERATQAGAANTLRFNGDEVIAENFDGIGLVRDIELNLGVRLRSKRVLMLGAGGATRGALAPILATNPASVSIVNRTLDKAVQLVNDVAPDSGVESFGYETMSDQRFDVVINGTSTSLFAECPPLSPGAFANCELAYEMTYGKGITPFLKLAQSVGTLQLADGVGMLVEQAAEAFFWWRGVRPNTKEAIAAISVPLV